MRAAGGRGISRQQEHTQGSATHFTRLAREFLAHHDGPHACHRQDAIFIGGVYQLAARLNWSPSWHGGRIFPYCAEVG